ncbi:DUF389 domain-containing protein [Nocardioides mangrovi]|uniref:DUF389 domain-containing protein n=1 Tax=Nocardioides mangrovi TaxID=2874580 RepID=A0ABS7UGX4_9ACTN|nr:DUF389 domain-containing protein [Nocardioides mangrovi]MBZ5740085.1 DUF389 domain-containing protein [Nocardioides mangrovi]
MVVHFRLTSPANLTGPTVGLLRHREWITNITLQEGAVIDPPGDLVECDVAREKAGELLHDLEELGVCAEGGVVITTPTGAPFRRAKQLEAAAPGHPDDAVIWEAVEAQAEAGAVPTVSYVLFMVIAVALASIAVITDSAVLVVGAMVVGPEFSAVAAASAGIALGRAGLIGRGLQLLVYSFAFAVAVIAVLALAAHVGGLITTEDVTRSRPNTGFIWHPDVWSVLVALLAGAAGALALALSKTATMVGVFISVTTVPAAGNLALGLAVWDRGEIVGSATQLGLNIGCMVLAGALVLVTMRLGWSRVTAWSERIFGRQADVTGARYR